MNTPGGPGNRHRPLLLGKPEVIYKTPPRAPKGTVERVTEESDIVVHRPGLTLNEVLVLAWCPYEESTPRFLVPEHMRRHVGRLIREGLLERYTDGAGVALHRCTALGIEVVQAYARGGFLGEHARKHAGKLGQSWRYRQVQGDRPSSVLAGYDESAEALVFERADR